MSSRVSAIIPVYNTPDAYLKECVESLLNQTYRDFEIILVDDGSKEPTAQLCDELAGKDDRIVVIHQKNQGPSAARNTGLRQATGDYLTFVDSDDSLLPNAWEVCVNKMNAAGADCLVFGWLDHTRGYPEQIPVSVGQDTVISAEEAIVKIASDNEACGGGYPWNKMWRAEALRRVHREIPLFDMELFAYEDKEWILRSLIGLNTVILIQESFYDYRFVEGSLTNKAESWERRQYNAYYAYDRIMELLKPVNKEAYRGAVNFYFYFGFMDLITQLKHPSWFGGWKRVRKTKKHMYRLCRKIRIWDLTSNKKKLAWLIMQVWGIL